MVEPIKPDPKTDMTELGLLASRIKAAHKSITEHSRNLLDRAIEAGDALNQAKIKLDQHGQWLAWLKTNCELSERSAQIYMQLANNKTKLKSAETADLETLAGALRFIKFGGGGGGGSVTASDAYDKAQEKLVEKLKNSLTRRKLRQRKQPKLFGTPLRQ